jgi:hypothetical protein
VRRLVVAIVAICAALAAVAWSGLGAPRVRAGHVEATTAGSTVYAWVELRNDGRVTARIDGVAWEPTIGLHPSSLTVAPRGATLEQPEGRLHDRAAATAPFEPFELRAGEARTLLLLGRVACGPTGPFTWELSAPEVTASAPVGPRRTLVLREGRITGVPDATACSPGR